MKKLLSLLAVSTLVGTSTSNLKQVFTNNVVNHGFKSNQLNKEISNRSKNDNPFINPIINAPKNILSLSITSDGTIWVGTDNGLYKSVDGETFIKVMKGFNVNTILTKNNGIIWVGDGTCLYKSTDNGINFDKIIKNPNDVVNCWKFAPNGTIWASSNIGLYKSTDEKTLTPIQLIGTTPKTNLEISLNGSIYVSVNGAGWDNSGLYKKSVDGENFNKISSLSGKEWLQNNKNINAVKSSNNGTIYVGTETGLYKSTDGILFNEIASVKVQCITNGSDGTIWVGTSDGLYHSIDGTIFNKIANNKSIIYTVKNAPNGTIYVGEYQGLYKIDLIDNLLTLNQPNYIGDKYDGFVYKNELKLDFKEQYLKSAMLDGNSITVPSTNVNIPVGEHTLVLTLKDEYKKYLDLFSGDVTTGQVTYKLWVKASVDKSKISYETNQDTDLLSGLVSDLGNTNGCDIIQTKAKTGTHNATLKTLFNSKMLDEQKSFYVQGTVDVTTNDFTETGTHQFLDLTKTEINVDGIYKMHLVDIVGNVYDCYYELGQSHWKLKGTFSDDELNKLSTKLNVTVNLTDPTQKQEANGWLQKYQSVVDSTFNSTVLSKGKGFNITVNDLLNGYKEFLEPVTYVNPQTQYAINQNKLDNVVIKIAEQKLQEGLNVLPQNLNVDTKNVVNKLTLDSYSIWIKGYDIFINNNKDQWINDVVKVSSRGFATKDQENTISNHVRGLDFKNYLRHVEWTPTTGLTTSSEYKQFIELNKLKVDIIDWVNNNLPDVNNTYQKAINDAESNLNLHGYSIDKILNGKPKPQTKTEIDKFADGQSYHDWLQTQANIKFRGWQFAIGFGIAIPLLLVVVAIGWVIRSRTNPKYNPIARGKKIKNEKMKNNNKEK